LAHGKVFLDFALGFLFLSRFQGVVSGHTGPWFYYFLALLLGFAPWSQFLPLALWQAWKDRRRDPQLLLLCFIIPAFIVFSIAKTKIPNYILPLYPALAILVAHEWDKFFNAPNDRRGFFWANLGLMVVTALLIIGFIIAGTGNYAGQYQGLKPNLLLLAATLIVGSLSSVLFFFLKKDKASFYALPAMVLVITLILTLLTLPAVENYKGEKELGTKVAAAIKPNEQIASYDVGNRPGVVYYNVQPVVFLTQEAEARSFLAKRQGYCFTTTDNFNKLSLPKRLFAQKGDLVILK
jgi:4-amino-4-deoxy-L-arabinose transferase-like glycosyltransferase